MALTLLLVWCATIAAAYGRGAPPPEKEDALFSFGGLTGLRDPDCVPLDYQLPERVQMIAQQCLDELRDDFAYLSEFTDDLQVRNLHDTYRTPGNAVRRFQLGIRDCMSEKMGYTDDSGEFVKERLSAEISALGFPEAFEKDVQAASRACLHHTPENLSVEQKQNFYYVCRDTLLEANCLYKRLEREDPESALSIGIKQTECLDNLKPSPNVQQAVQLCQTDISVPAQYASLRRRRSADHHTASDSAASLEGSGEEQGFVLEEEYEVPLADRLDQFAHCVHGAIGSEQDGVFIAANLIDELKQFKGEEQFVNLQVDAATRCQEKTKLATFNMCYYDDLSSGCHILSVQRAFLAGDPTLLPKYEVSAPSP